jgi:DNA-directed RNA polymerase subunit beta'
MKEDFDEITGLSTKVIISHRDEKKQPRISIKDQKGETIRRYLLPAGAHIGVSEGDMINAGDLVVKIPRESAKTKDITGGCLGWQNFSRRVNLTNRRPSPKFRVRLNTVVS